MLARARQKTADLSNVELQQGDATQLELPDGFCDAVMINQVSSTYQVSPGAHNESSVVRRHATLIMRSWYHAYTDVLVSTGVASCE